VQLGEGPADGGAMVDLRATDPHALEKGDDGGRPPGELAEGGAVLHPHRLRAGEAARREMLHEADEEGQVGGIHALFVERQDEAAGRGMEQEVGVLDTLGDALEGQELPDVVAREMGRELLGGDIGIDGHGRSQSFLSGVVQSGWATRSRQAEPIG
jgi:hypothetical protein